MGANEGLLQIYKLKPWSHAMWGNLKQHEQSEKSITLSGR